MSSSLCHRMADVLSDRIDGLVDIWQGLGDMGPTFGSAEAGSCIVARSRYLQPMARALIGALRSSANHTALYLDERLRYASSIRCPEGFRQTLRKNMEIEFGAIAELVGDMVPEEAVRRELWEFHKPLTDPPAPASKVLFIGDCLFVETRAFLVWLTAESGHPADVKHIFFSASQPMPGVQTAIASEVEQYRPDLIGLSLFTFEGVPAYRLAWRRAAQPLAGPVPQADIDDLVAQVHRTILDIRTVSAATVAVHIPCGLPLSGLRRRLPCLPAHSGAQRGLLRRLSAGLREMAASAENVITVDETAVAAGLGGVRAAAEYAFAADDVPPGYSHTSAFGPALGRHYQELAADHQLLGRAKALLVDFDNTLWQGIMAEGPVVHNTEGQRLLRELKDAGILLIALSKNDESSIRWDEMTLGPDDFVLRKINWQAKPDNAAEAIKELDLAPQAFVLLDDNPAERALVTEMVPGVGALDPAEPRAWQALRRWLAFSSTRDTDEARRRTVMYREAAERRAAMSQPRDYQTTMKMLGLRYTVRAAAAADLPRVTELIERTNQFNTTTRRWTPAEVKNLLGCPGKQFHVAQLRDRFGDLGVVAIAVFDTAGRVFDPVIMSCRAIGFGLEFALLRAAMDAAGPGPFRGLFIPTDRNGPAAQLFAEAGFHRADAETWVLPPDAAGPEVPPWLTRD